MKTIQFHPDAAALERAQVAHGADMTVPERLRELRRLNAHIFAALFRVLRQRPPEMLWFRRGPDETWPAFKQRMQTEKTQWTYSVQKAGR